MELIVAHENIKNKIMELVKNGKLTCAEAHRLAESEGVSLAIIGKVAEEAGIKISDCQLGCFGKHKES